MAFFGLYIWHGILIYVLVNRMSGFRWSTSNLRLGLIFLPATVIVFGVVFLLPVWPAAAVGVALTLITLFAADAGDIAAGRDASCLHPAVADESGLTGATARSSGINARTCSSASVTRKTSCSDICA
jgi:hypothetical protein